MDSFHSTSLSVRCGYPRATEIANTKLTWRLRIDCLSHFHFPWWYLKKVIKWLNVEWKDNAFKNSSFYTKCNIRESDERYLKNIISRRNLIKFGCAWEVFFFFKDSHETFAVIPCWYDVVALSYVKPSQNHRLIKLVAGFFSSFLRHSILQTLSGIERQRPRCQQ